jgi:hypothetical protein
MDADTHQLSAVALLPPTVIRRSCGGPPAEGAAGLARAVALPVISLAAAPEVFADSPEERLISTT